MSGQPMRAAARAAVVLAAQDNNLDLTNKQAHTLADAALEAIKLVVKESHASSVSRGSGSVLTADRV